MNIEIFAQPKVTALEDSLQFAIGKGPGYPMKNIEWSVLQDIIVRELEGRGFRYNHYGLVDMPGDFVPTLGFDLVRRSNGGIENNINVAGYYGSVKYYVDLVVGDDTTGDGSTGNPYKTVLKAMQVIEISGSVSFDVIVKSAVPFHRDEFYDTSIGDLTNKNVSIRHESGERVYVSLGQRALVWTAHSTGVWHCTRTNTLGVFDISHTDFNGLQIPYKNVDTLVECENEGGTWYTDGSLVYVHTISGTIPIENEIIVNVSVARFEPTILGTSRLYMENISFLSSSHTDGVKINGSDTGTVEGEFVGNGCYYIGSRQLLAGVGGNAFSIEGVGRVLSLDCKAAYALRDGFNYHYINVLPGDARQCLVFEQNCEAYDNGLDDANNTNNCSTGHEGISILRVGSIGWNSKGPIFADVDGCYSINYDCRGKNSVDATGNADIMQFQLDSDGVVRLYNCSGGGEGDADLKIIGSGSAYLRNFVSNRIEIDETINLTYEN